MSIHDRRRGKEFNFTPQRVLVSEAEKKFAFKWTKNILQLYFLYCILFYSIFLFILFNFFTHFKSRGKRPVGPGFIPSDLSWFSLFGNTQTRFSSKPTSHWLYAFIIPKLNWQKHNSVHTLVAICSRNTQSLFISCILFQNMETKLLIFWIT